MSTKSLLTKACVDLAVHSHNCQASRQHRVNKGDARLKVKNGRGWDHYCVDCAKKIIAKSQAAIDELRGSLP